MTDAELVRQACAGRTGAYGELVRRWAPRVVALCHAKCGRGAAEDLAQEVLLRGLRALDSLADPAKFGNWLYGIALRTCKDWLKAKERTVVRFTDLETDSTSVEFVDRADSRPELEAQRREETARLMNEVETLPEEYREVLMLFYYEDQSYRDIAEMLGVSAATVNMRLTKARAVLRSRLNVCSR